MANPRSAASAPGRRNHEAFVARLNQPEVSDYLDAFQDSIVSVLEANGPKYAWQDGLGERMLAEGKTPEEVREMFALREVAVEADLRCGDHSAVARLRMILTKPRDPQRMIQIVNTQGVMNRLWAPGENAVESYNVPCGNCGRAHQVRPLRLLDGFLRAVVEQGPARMTFDKEGIGTYPGRSLRVKLG